MEISTRLWGCLEISENLWGFVGISGNQLEMKKENNNKQLPLPLHTLKTEQESCQAGIMAKVVYNAF